MKKLSLFKILLVSVSILMLNSCSKSSETLSSGDIQDTISTVTHSAHPFDLAYVITPLTDDIRSITFNNEKGIPETVYNLDSFPGGIRDLRVSVNGFRARIEVAVGNMTSHPVGFRLQIRVNEVTVLTKDFTLPPMKSYMTAIAEYYIQAD
jgi:hypothetical protein